MQKYRVINWDKVKYDKNWLPKRGDNMRKFSAALRRFIFDPLENFEKYRPILARVQEIGGPGDMPAQPITTLLEKYHLNNIFDQQWQNLFDFRDLSGSTENGFDLDVSVSGGVTFQEIKPGQKVECANLTGTRQRVFFKTYGAGLAWHRSLFTEQKYWELEDIAIEFRNAFLYRVAQIHYALLEAVRDAKADIAFQNPDPTTLPNTDRTYNANRTAQTLNVAAETIINRFIANQKNYFADNPTTIIFRVVVPYQRLKVTRQAIDLGLDNYMTSEKHVNYVFVPQASLMLSSSDIGYVVVPQRKLKSVMKMNPTEFDDFDSLSYTYNKVQWFEHAAAIGDVDQVEPFSFV